LAKIIKQVSRAIEASNFDLSSLYTAEAYGAVYEAALDVTGLPEADVDDLKALLNKQRIIEAAILAASVPIQKSRIKRGFLVQLQLIPEETVMLLYGRDKPVMTTRWMRMDDASEVNLIVNKARQLLDSLAKNSWDTRSIKLSFRYDREVAARNR
jgi:predicted transcriptional regulator